MPQREYQVGSSVYVRQGHIHSTTVGSTAMDITPELIAEIDFPDSLKGFDKDAVDGHPTVQSAVAEAQRELDGSGRVLLRKSGTEPLVRVMVEAADHHQAQAIADRLADVVKSQLSLSDA